MSEDGARPHDPHPDPDPYVPGRLRDGGVPRPAVPTGRGPVVLVVLGVVALVLAVGVAVLGGRLLVGTLPLGVLTAGGTAGADVVAEAAVPGRTAVDLEGGTTYAVLLRTVGTEGSLDGEPTITGPDGVEVRTEPAVPSLTTSRGGAHAHTVAQLTATQTGPHVVTAPELREGASGSLLLVEATGTGALVGGILAVVASVFAALGLGAIGIGLLVGGLVWRHVRRRGPYGTRPA